GGLLGTGGYRWMTSMQPEVKVVACERPLAPPAGTVPRAGGELVVAREAYESRRSPVAPSAGLVGRGQKLFAIYCTPCHGVGGKGYGTVTRMFIPSPYLMGP